MSFGVEKIVYACQDQVSRRLLELAGCSGWTLDKFEILITLMLENSTDPLNFEHVTAVFGLGEPIVAVNLVGRVLG
jgi:hypothetical protein